MILQTRVVDDDTGRFFNQIIESTSISDYNGVVISRLSHRMDTCEGEVERQISGDNTLNPAAWNV